MSNAALALDYIEESLPSRRRTHREFAEQELILPNGPRKGLPFSCDFMPFSAAVLEEYDRGRYSEFYGSGPVQSGKTLIFFVEPALYHLFEVEEDVILGAPVVEMAQAAYLERLLPSIEASRYKRLLPLQGGGSRGGRALFIRFRNGATLRFMGAGGGDQQRSSYTARVVIATELDKMDEAGGASRETDPVSQIKARTSAYGAAARFYGECTMSVKSGRIHREVVDLGTDSRVFLPCLHCGEWVLPERSGLVGWQEAPDVLEARSRAGFQCPSCKKVWTEFDRQRAMRSPRIVAKGQSVTREGAVEGELPRTLKFGFRWNAMASPLLTMADIAQREWTAEQSPKAEDKKAIAQFVWAEPYEADLQDLTRVEADTVLRKMVHHERRAVPEGSTKLTLGVDVGSYVIWWALMAWRKDALGHLVDFGSVDVPHPQGGKDSASVLAALRALRDGVVHRGWDGRRPDLALVDSGWERDVVYQFVRESGEPHWLACKGFGSSSRNGVFRPQRVQTEARAGGDGWAVSVQPGGLRLVEVHSDQWKAAVHEGYGAAHGAPGSLTVFRAAVQDPQIRIYARQIAAEVREPDESPNKESGFRWVVISRQNHYLDATAYARCAAAMLGVSLVEIPRPVSPGPRTDLKVSSVSCRSGIRTRY